MAHHLTELGSRKMRLLPEANWFFRWGRNPTKTGELQLSQHHRQCRKKNKLTKKE